MAEKLRGYHKSENTIIPIEGQVFFREYLKGVEGNCGDLHMRVESDLNSGVTHFSAQSNDFLRLSNFLSDVAKGAINHGGKTFLGNHIVPALKFRKQLGIYFAAGVYKFSR